MTQPESNYTVTESSLKSREGVLNMHSEMLFGHGLPEEASDSNSHVTTFFTLLLKGAKKFFFGPDIFFLLNIQRGL